MATISENRDIDYIQKDFTSVADAIISFANVNYGPGTSANRLWTNFNLDSFSRNWLEIVALVADVFFFYFDNQATQSYLQTATVRAAVLDIAKQFGFVPASATSASGNAAFSVTGAGTILRGFRVQASNGEEFYVTNDIVAVSAGTVNGTVLQGVIKTEFFTAEGLQAEEFDLAGPNVIRDLTNLNPADISPQVVVNGNEYTLVDSFIRHNGQDVDPVIDSLGKVIGGGGRVFTLGERPDGTPFIKFGDGIFGRKLTSGEGITVIYRTGGGSAGNISPQALTTLVDSNPIVTAVTNNSEFSGGADEQTIEQLRQLIPASLRTLERAVAAQDYSDILTANFSEVFAASTEANTQDPGVDINIYVVPQGAGISKISENPLLKSKLASFIDRRKMVTVQFQILDAFGVDTLLTFEVFISDTSSKTTITQAINTAIDDFFDLSTGGSDGSGIGFAEQILLKDMANLIEAIPGVERFEIKRLTYRPRIEQNVVGLITTYNNSEVKVFRNVQELEWLLGAAGQVTETSGTVLFSNTSLIAFSYNGTNGELTYAFPVDLRSVAPGDLFRDGAGTDFTILGVDVPNNIVILDEGLTINNTVNDANDGSIRNGSTVFESFKCFKKIRAKATNLSVDSITDNDLSLSVMKGNGSALAPRVLLDNSNVFVPGEFATGDFFLVDAASNIWEIEENDSNTLKTSITAVNDAAITSVASGDYNIVKKLVGSQVLFNGSIFNIQFNSVSTVFSIGAQFSQIGTIGDDFAISAEQNNLGNLGVPLDLIAYNPATGEIRLNSAPSLEGVNADYVVIDNTGQLFNVVGTDNRAKPSVFYDEINKDTDFVLLGSGLGFQIAQGFQVNDTDTYAVVSFFLKRQGNILGNLTARIVDDDGTGLPDLGSPVAISNPINVTSIPEVAFDKIIFSFTVPPILSASTQYHLVLSSDAAYQGSQQDGIFSYDNSANVAFTYNSVSGVVSYAGAVNLSLVQPGHYFIDGAGDRYKVLAVNDSSDEITLDIGLSVVEATTGDGGSVEINDRVFVGVDSSSPGYTDGEFARYDGVNWSNSTQGPSPSGTNQDAIFSVEGTKTIKVDSNLTPAMGPNATVSTRYYDDENQISLVLGISNSSVTSAPDTNALGRGTVASVPNRPVDNFVFRTSRYADDIVNLRLNEIPQIDASDINIEIFGGVD
jgi:hypothetical protein